jgi:hypothetical protein
MGKILQRAFERKLKIAQWKMIGEIERLSDAGCVVIK